MNMEPNDYKVSRCPHGWVDNCALCAAAVEREKCLALRDPLREWLGDPDEAIHACISEIDRLVLENEALKKDAERLDWLCRKMFNHKWNGVIGKGWKVMWEVAGDFRHTQQHLVDDSGTEPGDFRRAIDAAIRARMSENGGTS